MPEPRLLETARLKHFSLRLAVSAPDFHSFTQRRLDLFHRLTPESKPLAEVRDPDDELVCPTI
jgi:hypothetical protein